MSTAPLSTVVFQVGLTGCIVAIFAIDRVAKLGRFALGFIDRRPAPGKRKYRWPGKFVASISLDIGLHSLPRRLIESGLFSFWKRKKKKKGKEGGAREKSRGELCFARFSVFMDVVFYGGFL